MEFLDEKNPCFVVDDTLLDFTFEDEEEDLKTSSKAGASVSSSSSSLESSNPAAAQPSAAGFSHVARNGLFPEFVEEELEWLSNKEAFPAVETCFGILSDNPELISNHKSPVSVLENITATNYSPVLSCFDNLKIPVNFPVNFPVRARSKRRRRTRRTCSGEAPGQQQHHRIMWLENKLKGKSSSDNIGRRCLHCQSDKTPQWRAGPMGPKTLCNACGVRYKSGRLLPEYRPANSPTFTSELHSNSHRKVVEMRKQKLGEIEV